MEKIEVSDDLYQNNAFHVCHIDRDLQITLISQSFLRLLSQPDSEMLNRPFTEFLKGDEIEKFKNQARHCLEKSCDCNSYYRFFFMEKHSIYVKLTLQPIFTEELECSECRVILVDLTDSEFTKMDFYLNRKRLDRINKTDYEGRLIGGMAHDYNDIMSAILLNVENISEILDPESDVWEEIQLIENMAKRGDSLTKQLLAFSHAQIEKMDVLNLNKLLIEMYSLVTRMAGDEVEVLLHTDSRLREIKMDKGQLENIVFNLATNSIESLQAHTKVKKIYIETEAVHLDAETSLLGLKLAPGNYSVLIFADTGIPPLADELENLIRPKFSHKENHEGLGLTTVANILRKIGGGLQISVRPSGGTEVKVFFPAHGKHYNSGSRQGNGGLPFKDSGRVLLVEDDKAVRTTIARVLSKFGYEVLEAGEFSEAMEIFGENRDNLKFVLTDVIMPKTSGPEMIQKMLKENPNTKYLFTSGYTERAFTEYGKLLNTNNFLQKPFSVQQLADKIKAALR